MNKNFLLILAFVLTTSAFSQDLDYPRLGIGIQGSFPAFGLSAKFDITEQHSAQAVIGTFNTLSAYFGRYSYNFVEEGNDFRYKPYVFGQAGLYTYNYPNTYGITTFQEKVFGFGAGAGIEYYYAPLTYKLRMSIEIGYGKAYFDYYRFNSVSFGVGVHYYFEI